MMSGHKISRVLYPCKCHFCVFLRIAFLLLFLLSQYFVCCCCSCCSCLQESKLMQIAEIMDNAQFGSCIGLYHQCSKQRAVENNLILSLPWPYSMIWFFATHWVPWHWKNWSEVRHVHLKVNPPAGDPVREVVAELLTDIIKSPPLRNILYWQQSIDTPIARTSLSCLNLCGFHQGLLQWKFISGTSVGRAHVFWDFASAFTWFFCLRSALIQFLGDIDWRNTQNWINPDGCTMNFLNWFRDSKNQNAFAKNLKKPAVANGDLGVISASKIWRCDHCWPKYNTISTPIKGWSSHRKLRLCLKRFTTPLQTTPIRSWMPTIWIKCTTIDGRTYCTNWFEWNLNFFRVSCMYLNYCRIDRPSILSSWNWIQWWIRVLK